MASFSTTKASVRSPIEQKKLSKLAQKAKVKEKQMTEKLNEKTINQPDNEQNIIILIMKPNYVSVFNSF